MNEREIRIYYEAFTKGMEIMKDQCVNMAEGGKPYEVDFITTLVKKECEKYFQETEDQRFKLN